MAAPLSIVTRAEAAYDQVGGGRPLTGGELEALCGSNPELEPVLRQLHYLQAELTANLESSEQPEVPGYEMLERLGAGGMGVVWAARHDTLERVVAIKFLSGTIASDSHARSRFLDEARTVAKIRHHHVVPVHDVVETDSRAALIMELVPGADLHTVLEAWSNHDKEPDEALAEVLGDSAGQHNLSARDWLLLWGNQVAQALSAAHAAGVLHRDVKPSNIRVRSGDRDAVLLDFGVARPLDTTVQTIGFAGTPRFAAPEQLQGRRIDERTDVFGLARSLEHGFARVLGLPDRLNDDGTGSRRGLRSDLEGKLGKDVEAVLGRALESDPRDRYPSAAAFARDLDRARHGEDVEARPRGPMLRLAQGAVRQPLRSGLVVAAAAAIALGVVLFQEWPRIEAARRAEQRIELQARIHFGFQLVIDPKGREAAVLEFTDIRRLDPDSNDARLGHVAALALLGREDEAWSVLGVEPGEETDPPELGWIIDPSLIPEDPGALGPFPTAERQASFAMGLYLCALRSDRDALFGAAAKAFADHRFRVSDATEHHFGAMAYAASRGGLDDLMESAITGLRLLWPDSATAWTWIALATERSDPEQSLAAVQEVDRRDPVLSRYLRPLAMRAIYKIEGPSGVEDEIEAVLKENPLDSAALILRVRLDLSRKETDRADQTLREILEREPRNQEAHELMAERLWRGDPDELREHLVALTELKSAFAAAWRNLGVHDLRQKNYEEAVASLERCVSLDPFDGPARAMFGEALYGLRDPRAAETLIRAAEMLPTSARPHYYLSQVRHRAGDIDGSIEALEESLRRLDAGGDGVRRVSVENALRALRR